MLQTFSTLEELGTALKARRLELNLPQAEVARGVNLSRVTLSKLESGAATDLKLSSLLRLLRHYGLKPMLAPGGRTPTLMELDLRRQLENRAALQVSEPQVVYDASGRSAKTSTRQRARRKKPASGAQQT